MKTIKGIKRDCRNVFNRLNSLSKEVGGFAINTGWEHDKSLKMQCNKEKLIKFAKRYGLEIVKEGYRFVVNMDEIELFHI